MEEGGAGGGGLRPRGGRGTAATAAAAAASKELQHEATVALMEQLLPLMRRYQAEPHVVRGVRA